MAQYKWTAGQIIKTVCKLHVEHVQCLVIDHTCIYTHVIWFFSSPMHVYNFGFYWFCKNDENWNFVQIDRQVENGGQLRRPSACHIPIPLFNIFKKNKWSKFFIQLDYIMTITYLSWHEIDETMNFPIDHLSSPTKKKKYRSLFKTRIITPHPLLKKKK